VARAGHARSSSTLAETSFTATIVTPAAKMRSRYNSAVMFLFRPVGIDELRLIAESGFRAFPPRLPQQPIFYPVLAREYAEQIARDWNTAVSGHAGFVTMFEIDDDFASRYPVQVVGDRRHQELWVPAEELAEFNRHVNGRIEVVSAFTGPGFAGKIDPVTKLPDGLMTGGRVRGGQT
jgi:hypothetical protein